MPELGMDRDRDGQNESSFRLRVSSALEHEPYVTIVTYTFRMRSPTSTGDADGGAGGGETLAAAMAMATETITKVPDSSAYLSSQTNASLVLPVSVADHLKLCSVLVEYAVNGQRFHVASLERIFQFFETFRGILRIFLQVFGCIASGSDAVRALRCHDPSRY